MITCSSEPFAQGCRRAYAFLFSKRLSLPPTGGRLRESRRARSRRSSQVISLENLYHTDGHLLAEAPLAKAAAGVTPSSSRNVCHFLGEQPLRGDREAGDPRLAEHDVVAALS